MCTTRMCDTIARSVIGDRKPYWRVLLVCTSCTLTSHDLEAVSKPSVHMSVCTPPSHNHKCTAVFYNVRCSSAHSAC